MAPPPAQSFLPPHALTYRPQRPAACVSPEKDSPRKKPAPAEPTSLTPLNRLVDAIPLESHPGLHFRDLAEKYLASSCHDANAEARLRTQLALWRDNDAKLQPLIQRSFLVKENAATSQDLSAVGAAGLAALDAVHQATRPDDSWKAQQLAILAQAQKPKAQLLLIPAPAVQMLVEAAAAGGACSAGK